MGRAKDPRSILTQNDAGMAIMEGCLRALDIDKKRRRDDIASANLSDDDLSHRMKQQPRDLRAIMLMAQYKLLLTDRPKANDHLTLVVNAETGSNLPLSQVAAGI